MSRREFRGAVESPRPLAALLMVACAYATLDITRQLAPWAVAAQVASLGFAFWRRANPFPWQRRPWILNLVLGVAVGAGTALYVQGQPSVIALAHFATLAQALQLLDARPRRSEFLLVALALFQVILASNLTDSLLYPPLLIVFLPATVWTLLVHTLHVEALEAGDPHAASRATTPGVLRMTLVASTLSVLLALVLFLVLPRMRSGIGRGPGAGAGMATAGFSDRVELGELGRIRSDPTVVLRVDTLAGEPPAPDASYWRGLAFDHFDGRRWSITPAGQVPVVGNPEFGVPLGRRGDGPELVQQIVREPVVSGVIFAHGTPRSLAGSVPRLERDVNEGLYSLASSEHRIVYTVVSQVPRWREAELRADRAVAPAGEARRYAMLPRLGPSVRALAERITAHAETDADRARSIETFLRREGRYTDVPPRFDENGRSPVELFLEGELAGHCEYFASAMVVLGRSAGLPMRMVNGFAGGRRNRIGGFVTLSRADAHAWVEMHFENAGWVRYDPTPPDLRTQAAAAEGWLDRGRELASAIELWWFRRVVDFDRTTQARAMVALWRAWQGWSSEPRGDSARAAPRRAAAPPDRWVEPRALAVAVLCVVAGAVLLGVRGRGRESRTVPSAYLQALRLLRRRGLVRDPATTPRAFAEATLRSLSPQAGAAFAALTEAYLAERFGGRPAATRARLRDLRDSLRG